MTMNQVEILRTKIDSLFTKSDYPCLLKLAMEMSKTKPLSGYRILHGTPVYNTVLPKLFPLFCSGAEVAISLPERLPFDKKTLDFLSANGFTFIEASQVKDNEYDIHLDCGGRLAGITPKIGTIELTRSGEHEYVGSKFPCISVDSSQVKLIEDTLGTADGFMRVLHENRYDNIEGKCFVIVGFGKVGKGIGLKLTANKARVLVIEDPDQFTKTQGFDACAFTDHKTVQKFVWQADFVVFATGVTHCLERYFDKDLFLDSKAILMSLGANDEFGPTIPNARVFFNKRPANFSLESPTKMRYLDSTFAFHSACCLALTSAQYPDGISLPPADIENDILCTVFETLTSDELNICVQAGLIKPCFSNSH